MSSKWSKKFQYGIEVTRGTLVAATRVWTGDVFQMASDTRLQRIESDAFGARGSARRVAVQQFEFGGTLVNSHGIFQQLPFLFNCGIKGGVTGGEVTPSQGDYLWTFNPSFTAANSPNAFTGEFSFDDQEWESGYCMFKEYRISGEISQGPDPSPVKIEADFFGRKKAKSTFTAGQSLHTPTGMNAKLARLYSDSSWAGVGGTEVAAQLRAFALTLVTGVRPNHTGGADDTFTHHSEGIIGWNFGFTLESGATAQSFYDAHRAGSTLFLRFDIAGPQIGSGTNHRFRFDMSGIPEEVNPDGEDDAGLNLSSFTVSDLYDGTGAKHMALAVTTNVNAV